MPSISHETILPLLFGPGVVTEEMVSPALVDDLSPAERACVDGAELKRKIDFATGRVCARRALARLGLVGSPLRTGLKGQPLWPAGVTGSISHCQGRCGAAVAWQRHVQGIGLDIERIQSVDDGCLRLVATPAEREWIWSLPHGKQGWAALLLFSAKECFYKCQFPLTGHWLDFHDVRIVVRRDEPVFEAVCVAQVDWGGVEFSPGRYVVRDGYVFTGITASRAAESGGL